MADWSGRLRASGIHLAISVAIGLVAAAVVFLVWYPYPYREISGGRELFAILVAVDVVIGPAITFGIFNRKKSARELAIDVSVVALLQLAALGYGMWTVAVARPVHLVFEVERLRVVHAIDVPDELLGREPAGIEALPWTGPTLLAVRPFRDAQEQMDATMAALGGIALSARPDLWEPYDRARPRILQAAKPVAQLRNRPGINAVELDAQLRRTGRDPAQLAYLPVVSRKYFWTALIDPVTADVVGFLPLDSF
jgi:hypothetical protein